MVSEITGGLGGMDELLAMLGQSGADEAPPSALPGLLLAAGVLLVGLAVWRSLRKKLKRSFRQARESSEERIERVRGKATAGERQRIESYMTDAEELTRRLAALLDNKAARAEAMIDRAEQRLAALEAREGGRAEPAAERAPAVETRRVAPAARASEPEPEARADAVRYEPADPVTVDIYRLADEGRTAVEIAQELEEHTGKVELILALRE